MVVVVEVEVDPERLEGWMIFEDRSVGVVSDGDGRFTDCIFDGFTMTLPA
jgi:hypothetical protein